MYKQKSIIIYPNPANDILHITLPGTTSSVDIFNALGQKVYQSAGENLSTINISSFSNGLYIIRAKIKTGLIESKFMVLR